LLTSALQVNERLHEKMTNFVSKNKAAQLQQERFVKELFFFEKLWDNRYVFKAPPRQYLGVWVRAEFGRLGRHDRGEYGVA
jgi:hypothetical protein